MDVQVGDRIGGLTLTEELGRGGFGSVFRAQPDVGHERAVKLLHDPGRLDGLRQEASALSSLAHTNIVALIQADLTHEPPYLVTELVEGFALTDVIPYGDDNALAVARGVLAGLAHAHARGIVHLDLKPANVLISRTGVPKITDFGLARSAEQAELEQSLVASSPRIAGTVAYMAPEQREGKPGDERSDMYAFGVLLCEMMTGRLPQPGDTLPELLERAVPKWARVLFEGCYTRYDRRFANASEALQALEAALSAPPPIRVTIPGKIKVKPRGIHIVARPRAPYCRTCGTGLGQARTRCFSCGHPPLSSGGYCSGCGGPVSPRSRQCGQCRTYLAVPEERPGRLQCALVAFLLPVGIHRAMIGQPAEGVLQFLLVFAFGIGVLWSWIDGLRILSGDLHPVGGWES